MMNYRKESGLWKTCMNMYTNLKTELYEKANN